MASNPVQLSQQDSRLRMMSTGGNTPAMQATSAPPMSDPLPPQSTGGSRSPVQLMDWRSRLAEGNTNAQTRTVQPNETVNHQLNNLIREDSQYLRQARDNAYSQASARGMMMSTMAAGNAQRAAIDAALPIASQDATTYGRTASENMAAVNQDRLADQGMWGQLTGQEMGVRANLDEAERNRGWQSGENLLTRQHQTSERREGQTWQSGENLLNRRHTTSEREASQNWQRAERELTQNWQGTQNDLNRLHEINLEKTREVHDAAMRQLDRNHALTMQERQQLQERFGQFNQAMVQHNINLSNTLSAIYSNPNLTAAQQQQAAANARAVHDSLYQSYAGSMSGGLPQIFWDPYEMPPPAPPMSTPTPPTPVSTGNPAQDYLTRNPDVAADPYFRNNPQEHYRRYGMMEGRTWAQ